MLQKLSSPSTLGLRLLLWNYDFCEPEAKPLVIQLRSNIIRRFSNLMVKSKRKGRFSEPRWEAVFSGILKEFDRRTSFWDQHGRFSRASNVFAVSKLYQLLIKTLVSKKCVSKVPLTLMGSKQVLNGTWPQNSSRQRSSPAQHSSQTQPKQASGRNKGPDMVLWEETRAARPWGTEQENHGEPAHQENVLLINSILCLFAGFPLGNSRNCWKS